MDRCIAVILGCLPSVGRRCCARCLAAICELRMAPAAWQQPIRGLMAIPHVVTSPAESARPRYRGPVLRRSLHPAGDPPRVSKRTHAFDFSYTGVVDHFVSSRQSICTQLPRSAKRARAVSPILLQLVASPTFRNANVLGDPSGCQPVLGIYPPQYGQGIRNVRTRPKGRTQRYACL